MRVMFQFAIVI